MEEQASAEEGTPRSGLIDRWLATRPADDDVTAVETARPSASAAAPSALSRLAERRAQRGGKQRDFAAEILGAINDPEPEAGQAPDAAAADVTSPVVAKADVAGPLKAPVTPITGPSVPIAAAVSPELVDEVAPEPLHDPTVGRLSLAGLRARRKAAGFDPLDTRVSVLAPVPTDEAPAQIADAGDADAQALDLAEAEPEQIVDAAVEPTAESVAAEAAEEATEEATEADPEAIPEPEADAEEPAAAAAAVASETVPAEAVPAPIETAATPAPVEAAPQFDVQATNAALAGAVPERDERAERLARMVRQRRGDAAVQPPTPTDTPENAEAQVAAEEVPTRDEAKAEEVPVADAIAPTAAPDVTTERPEPAVAAAAEPVLNFDAPEIPAAVDVFASLRDTVKEAPKPDRAEPIDVLAALRDLPRASARAAQQAQQPAPVAEEQVAGTVADSPVAPAVGAAPATPHDLPNNGGTHAATPAAAVEQPAAEPAEPADEPAASDKSSQAGKRRAKVSADAPPPNPAADDAIMALALEAVLRAEERGGPAAATPAEAKAKPPASRTPEVRPTPSETAAKPVRERAPKPVPQAPASPEPADDDAISRKHRPPAPTGYLSGGVPALVEFAPQRSTQNLLAMFMFLSAVATIGTGYLAYDSRAITEIAIAAFCGVLTLILWSAHSTAAPARIQVVNGTLEVRSKDSHHRFDLTSPYTDLVAAGTPGRRNWKVSIARKSMRAFVIDSTMVDGREFMPVLEACQAEARRRATESDRRRHGQ